MNLLSNEDLEQVTGAKQPAKQAEVLERNGIYYIKRMDNTIVTTWYHINHPRQVQHVADSMPNFEAIQ